MEHEERIKHEILESGASLPEEHNITTRIDHFNASSTDTFPMRYLVDKTYYNSSQGPLLFFTGGESGFSGINKGGGVWGFYNNTGFVVETLAKRFGAIVVFAEHRYYGASMPFGDQSFNVTAGNLRFLTIEQVMQDFIAL